MEKLNKEQLENIGSLINILQLSLVHRRVVGMNKNTKELCFVEIDTTGEFMYSPVESEEQTWIFGDKIENFLLPDYTNNFLSVQPEPSKNLKAEKQKIENDNKFLINNGKKIKFNNKNQENILSIKIQDPELRRKADLFEKLIIKKLSEKSGHRNAMITKKYYKDYVDIIENIDNIEDKETKIEILTVRLKKTMSEPKQKKTEQKKDEEENKMYPKFKIRLVSGAMILATLFAIYFFSMYGFDFDFFNSENKNEPKIEKISTMEGKNDKNIERKKYSEKEIEKLINNYINLHKVNISEWRKQKIIKSFGDKKFSVWEANYRIEKIINTKFKPEK